MLAAIVLMLAAIPSKARVAVTGKKLLLQCHSEFNWTAKKVSLLLLMHTFLKY